MKSLEHPRIDRLDREMMNEGKRFDYIWLTHRGERYRVCVERQEDGTLFASTKCVGRVLRVTHETPSGCVGKLIYQMNWAIDRWIVDHNYQLEVKRKLTETFR